MMTDPIVKPFHGYMHNRELEQVNDEQLSQLRQSLHLIASLVSILRVTFEIELKANDKLGIQNW